MVSARVVDNNPPVPMYASVEPGARNVPRDASFKVFFSEDMKAASLNGASLRLVNSATDEARRSGCQLLRCWLGLRSSTRRHPWATARTPLRSLPASQTLQATLRIRTCRGVTRLTPRPNVA